MRATPLVTGQTRIGGPAYAWCWEEPVETGPEPCPGYPARQKRRSARMPHEYAEDFATVDDTRPV